MLTATHLMTHLAPESISRARCTLVKALYLKRIKSFLKRDPDAVLEKLKSLRTHLCIFSNFRVLVVADLEKLKYPVSSWDSFLKGVDTSKALNPLGRRLDRLSDAGQHPGKLAYIVPMPTIDSSFLSANARGPTTFADPKLPALMVAMSYLNAVEGPLWVAVRGTGLAYGTTMMYDIESGHVNLDVYRSPDAFRAFEASKNVVEEFMTGKTQFDDLMLEGAVSGIVVAFANEQQTLAGAATASFVRQVMKRLPDDYQEKMLKRVREITVDEIKTALREQVWPMFTPGKADVLVTCAPGLKDTIKEGLESVGFTPEIHDLDYFQDDYGLRAGDDDEDGDDEGGEEEEEEDDNDDDNDDDDDFEIVDGHA